MKIKSINHDEQTNTVTIFEENKLSPIVCQALEAKYDVNNHLSYLMLDRVIAPDAEEGYWCISSSFVTEIARNDVAELLVKNNIINKDIGLAMQH